MLGGIWALIADSVDSLYLKAVDRVSPQIADEHPGLSQTQLSRDKIHIVVAVGAGAPVSLTLLAHYVVDDIITAARLPGGMPLQDHRGFIHDGDDVPRAGWDTCRHTEEICKPMHGQLLCKNELGSILFTSLEAILKTNIIR